MKKIWLAVLLAAALLLGGCSQEPYVAKVGKEKITADEFSFYLESVKQQMEGTEITSEDDWQTTEIEGRTAIEIARERALQTAIDNLMYIEAADKLGIQLSKEDEERIDSLKAEIISQYGSEEQFKAFLKEYKLNDDFIDMMCRSMICSEKLTEKLQAEEPVTDAELEQYFTENQEELNTVYRKAKHILRLTKDMTTYTPLSDEEIAVAENLARTLEIRAKNGEDFDALMAEYSEDPGSKTYPDGYVFTDGEMDPAFQEGVDNLEIGGIGLVESSYGWHVIKRLPLEFDDVKDMLSAQILQEKLETKLSQWETELNISIERNEEVLRTLN